MDGRPEILVNLASGGAFICKSDGVK